MKGITNLTKDGSSALLYNDLSLVGNRRAQIYLVVPFLEKDRAKELGARFDPEMKAWYAPHCVDLWPFRKWWPAPLREEVERLNPQLKKQGKPKPNKRKQHPQSQFTSPSIAAAPQIEQYTPDKEDGEIDLPWD